MRIKNIAYFFLCLSCIFILGCKTKQEQTKIQQTDSKYKGENFENFYNRFISDKNFQISRVTFPLKCLIAESDRDMKVMYKKDWVPMVIPIDKVDINIYKVKKTRTQNEVTHSIYIENSDTDIFIKYKQIKGKWYLIYYKSIML